MSNLTDEQRREVVREFLQKNPPHQYGVTAWDFYRELLRSVAPKPKSAIEKAMEVLDKFIAGSPPMWRDLHNGLKDVRAEIAALDDGGEGKGA